MALVLTTISSLPVSSASSPVAIPYRTAAAVGAGSIAWAMLATVLLLGVLVGCLAYARRRGWLAAAGLGVRAAHAVEVEIRATRRVSSATTLHVVRCDGVDYLLVEAMRGTHAVVSRMHGSEQHREEKP